MAIDTKETYRSFPNPLANSATKQDKKYGLEYAKAIWANYANVNVGYVSRRQRDIINRKYAEGLESIDKYKDRLDLKGDTSYLNLDFNPVNIIATRVDNMVGRLSNMEYKIQCNPIDPASRTELDKKRTDMMVSMFLKKNGAKEFEEVTGTSLIPKSGEIPETDEELDLHFQLNIKQDSSIAMEEGLSFVFMNNNWKDSEKKIIRDLIVLKKSAAHVFYDENYNLRAEYADPVDLIYPYSKYDDFRNIPYVGIQKQYTIQQLSCISDFTEEELWKIARQYTGKNQNANNWQFGTSYEGYYPDVTAYSARPYDNFNISVLEFYFLSPETSKYVKKSRGDRFYFSKKSADYQPPKDSKFDFEVSDKKINYRYEGKWIVGSDFIFGYKKSHNIPREKVKGGYSPECSLPIKMIFPDIYDMENKSLVERMMPHEDQINIIHLKSQQLLIKARPPGVAIDLEGIEGAIKGMGDSNMKPIEITKMYDQTGSYIYRSRNENGEVINPRVITPLDNGIAKDFLTLFSAYNQEVEKLNAVIGYNSSVDASTPSTEALVGVQKLAAQASNNSLRPIQYVFKRIVEMVAKDLTLMIQDSIEFQNEAFANAIGIHAVKTLEYGKKLAMNQFGIQIEFLPTEEEKAEIQQLLALGIEKGTLETSDVVLVKQVMKQNVKMAAQLLVLREKKNKENKLKESMALQQQNGEIQAQSGERVAQANMQAEQIMTQSKSQLLQVEYDLKAKLSAQEHIQKLEEIQAQNQGKVQVQQVANVGKEKAIEKQHESDLSHTAFESSIAPEKTAVQ